MSRYPTFPSTVNDWRATGGLRVFDRNSVFDYMNGGGELYLAYDFQRVRVQNYTKPGAPCIVAETYEMRTSEDAYGVFTHDPEGDDSEVGQDNAYAAGLLRFRQGRFCFRILAERDTAPAKDAVVALARTLAEGIDPGPRPHIVACLPQNGLDADSIRYFHTQVSLNSFYYLSDTNMLGLSKDTDAVMGTYRRHGQKMVLFIIHYGRDDKAVSAYREFGRVYLKDTKAPAGPERFETIEQGRSLGIHRVGSYLILVLDATARDACEQLLSEATSKCR